MLEQMDKVYFTPGNTVTLKQELPNKPVMIVKSKETKTIRDTRESTHFIGIKCFWFTREGAYQEQIFNTKDLIHTEVPKEGRGQ